MARQMCCEEIKESSIEDTHCLSKITHFKEEKQVKCLIEFLTSSLPLPTPLVPPKENVLVWDQLCDCLNRKDKALDTLANLLKPYAEQPKLLDRYLQSMVHPTLEKLLFYIEILFKEKTWNGSNCFSEDFSSSQSFTVYEKNVLDFNVCVNSADFAFYVKSLSLVQDINLTTSILYTLCMVCGPERVCQYFSTDVYLLELILTSLEWIVAPQTFPEPPVGFHQKTLFSLFKPIEIVDPRSADTYCDTTWKLVFILLWWMTLLILVPFEARTFGTQKRQYTIFSQAEDIPVFKRTFFVIQECLKHPTLAIQKATATLASKFFSRSDIAKEEYPSIFLNLCKEYLNQNDQEVDRSNNKLAYLQTLKSVLKRNPTCFEKQCFWDFLGTLEQSVCKRQSLKKSLRLHKCLTSIVGLVLQSVLPSQPRPWCYISEKQGLFGLPLSVSEEYKAQDLMLSSQELHSCETVLDFLFQALEDSTLLVRWVAAKRLACIVQRLPQSLAREVVHHVIGLIKLYDSRQLSEVFDKHVSMLHETTCSGALLALAELLRRQCILVADLEPIIQPLCPILTYEPVSTGHHDDTSIRDAACFVSWALTRCFSPSSFAPFVSELNQALICASLFDRDVNCRRAASAALQEHIGRQENFLHGISLLGLIHYYSVSTRRSSYLNVAPKVAQLDGYESVLLNFLVQKKLLCWDTSLRVLACQSLFCLGVFAPVTLLFYWIDVLIKKVLLTLGTSSLAVRHGALLGLSALLFNLGHQQRCRGTFTFILHEKFTLRLRNLVPQIEKSRGYRGHGGDLIREAICFFIVFLSWNPDLVVFKESVTLKRYFQTLLQCLRHFSLSVQLSAIEAIYILAQRRCSFHEAKELMNGLLHDIKGNGLTLASRQGYLLAVGAVAQRCREESQLLIQCLETLCFEAKTTLSSNERDASSRRAALVSLGLIIEAFVDTDDKNIYEKNCKEESFLLLKMSIWDGIPWEIILDTLMICGVDYQVDKRGDVGSWVREATIEIAVLILEIFLIHLQAKQNESSNVKIKVTQWSVNLINLILRQTMDKSNRLRSRAVYLLYRFLTNLFYIEISCHKKAMDFHNVQCLFPRFTAKMIYRRIYNFFSYELISPDLNKKINQFVFYEFCSTFQKGSQIHHDFFPYASFLYSCIVNVLYDVREKNLSINNNPKKKTLTESTLVHASYEHKQKDCNKDEQQQPLLQNEEHKAHDNSSPNDFIEDSFASLFDDMDMLGLFVKKSIYNYVTQTKFEKSAVTIKVEEFTCHDLIFKNLFPLLALKPYRTSLLEGLTNFLGLSMGTEYNLVLHELTEVLNQKSLDHSLSPDRFALHKIFQEYTISIQWIADAFATALITKVRYASLENIWPFKSIVSKPTRQNNPTTHLVYQEDLFLEKIEQNITEQSSQTSDDEEAKYQIVPFHFTRLSYLLTTLSIFLNIEAFQSCLAQTEKILPFCSSLMIYSTNVQCLRACIKICCVYITSSRCFNADIKRECLLWCLLMLIHTYPVIREFCCKTLYSSLLVIPEKELQETLGLHPNQSDTLLDVLSSVCWWATPESYSCKDFRVEGPPGVTLNRFKDFYISLNSSCLDDITQEIYREFYRLLDCLNFMTDISAS